MRPYLLTAIALTLTGCPRAPTPVRVDPAKVVGLSLLTANGRLTFCPHGDAPQIAAQATLDDGKIVQTRSAGEGVAGRLEVAAFEWTTSWGQIDDDARLRLPYDPIGALDRDVKISARLVDRPDLVAELSLAPDYGCGGTAGGYGATGYSGEQGAYGYDGQQGEAGRDGQDGNSGRDGQDGDDGGDGSDGSNGGDAGDGGDGGPGPEIVAMLTQVDTARHGPLVAISIPSTGELYLHDPDGEAFWIVAMGGAGGSGGQGGQGGRGGNGGQGGRGGDGDSSDGGNGGNGGRGGNGGNGGDGGMGGRGGDGGEGGVLHVIVDGRWPELAERIGLSTAAGDGGAGGYGGYGGSGGSAGQGGYSGSGASSGSTGSAGQAGNSGANGASGPGGRAGRDGAGAQVSVGDVAAAFKDLEAGGIWSPR